MWMQHERAAQPPKSASSTQARKTSFRKPGMMVPQHNLSVQIPKNRTQIGHGLGFWHFERSDYSFQVSSAMVFFRGCCRLGPFSSWTHNYKRNRNHIQKWYKTKLLRNPSV